MFRFEWFLWGAWCVKFVASFAAASIPAANIPAASISAANIMVRQPRFGNRSSQPLRMTAGPRAKPTSCGETVSGSDHDLPVEMKSDRTSIDVDKESDRFASTDVRDPMRHVGGVVR